MLPKLTRDCAAEGVQFLSTNELFEPTDRVCQTLRAVMGLFDVQVYDSARKTKQNPDAT